MNDKIVVLTLFALFMIFQIASHAAKCTDALMYDVGMLGSICMFLCIVWYLWD